MKDRIHFKARRKQGEKEKPSKDTLSTYQSNQQW